MFAAKYAHLPQAPLKKNLKEQTLHIMLKKFKEHIPWNEEKQLAK